MCDWETYQELEDGSIWSYVDRMENAERYAYRDYCGDGKETEIVVKVPLPPKDKYIIKAVKEIDDEQADYIETHRWKLADKIHEEHISPTLDMFNLPPKKENDCNEHRNHKHSHRKSQSLNDRKRA